MFFPDGPCPGELRADRGDRVLDRPAGQLGREPLGHRPNVVGKLLLVAVDPADSQAELVGVVELAEQVVDGGDDHVGLGGGGVLVQAQMANGSGPLALPGGQLLPAVVVLGFGVFQLAAKVVQRLSEPIPGGLLLGGMIDEPFGPIDHGGERFARLGFGPEALQAVGEQPSLGVDLFGLAFDLGAVAASVGGQAEQLRMPAEPGAHLAGRPSSDAQRRPESGPLVPESRGVIFHGLDLAVECLAPLLGPVAICLELGLAGHAVGLAPQPVGQLVGLIDAALVGVGQVGGVERFEKGLDVRPVAAALLQGPADQSPALAALPARGVEILFGWDRLGQLELPELRLELVGGLLLGSLAVAQAGKPGVQIANLLVEAVDRFVGGHREPLELVGSTGPEPQLSQPDARMLLDLVQRVDRLGPRLLDVALLPDAAYDLAELRGVGHGVEVGQLLFGLTDAAADAVLLLARGAELLGQGLLSAAEVLDVDGLVGREPHFLGLVEHGGPAELFQDLPGVALGDLLRGPQSGEVGHRFSMAAEPLVKPFDGFGLLEHVFADGQGAQLVVGPLDCLPRFVATCLGDSPLDQDVAATLAEIPRQKCGILVGLELVLQLPAAEDRGQGVADSAEPILLVPVFPKVLFERFLALLGLLERLLMAGPLVAGELEALEFGPGIEQEPDGLVDLLVPAGRFEQRVGFRLERLLD